jgi:hypothetical protein
MYYSIIAFSTRTWLMRITVYQKTYRSFLYLIIFFILIALLFPSPVFGQDEEALVIEIFDSNNWNESVGTMLFEGRSYDITISTENDSVILGVNVTVLGVSYNTTTDQPFITIIAPTFDETETFVITATKEGYLPDEIEVNVTKGALSAVSQPTTVEEKKNFQVTVTDQNHLPVENVLVYLTDDSEPVITDVRGIVTLTAPEVTTDTSLTVQVIKNGYQSDSFIVRVKNTKGFILTLSTSDLLQLLPLLIAVLVVIFAVVIVSWRKKRSPAGLQPQTRIRPQDQTSTNLPERQDGRPATESAVFSVNGKKNIPLPTSDSRVEEIRIPVQEKKKETTILTDEKEPPRQPVNQKKEHDEWFKGQDYMRYKLDEMTGKIDQNTDGKWFEGERDIRYKVDEALKKNVKKKKDDEDDTK